MAFETIEVENLSEILAGGKARGAYDAQLKEFLDAAVPGARVDTANGVFKGKKPQTVKSGFENAKERLLKLADKPEGTDKVIVRISDGAVYLIREDLLEG